MPWGKHPERRYKKAISGSADMSDFNPLGSALRKLIICESGKIIIFKASSLDEMNIAFDEAYPKLQHCMK